MSVDLTKLMNLEDGKKMYGALRGYDKQNATKANPEFTGSVSMGRQESSDVGNNSTALGTGIIAKGDNEAVVGMYNADDTITKWESGTNYVAGSIAAIENPKLRPRPANPKYDVYVCIEPNSDETFDSSKWEFVAKISNAPGKSLHRFAVGTGSSDQSRQNGFSVRRDGKGYFKGDVFVNCNENGTGGTKVAKVTDIIDPGAYYIDRNLFGNPTSVNSNASSVINAAIIDAQTKGLQYCVIPEGEYWITQTIYLKSDVILCGCGIDATTLKIADGCDIDAIRVAEPVNNSGLMDLTIDGNRIQNYSTYVNGHHGNAINVWLHYGRIERVRTNWVFKHSLLLNYDTGTGDDGLGFEPEHQNDMGNLNKVLWCDFRDSLLQGVMWGWRTMDSWMCYTNIGSHAANLYLEGGTSRFIGNHFDGDGDNGAGPEYNVYCGDGCRAMVFEGNIFENTQKENIFFRQPSYSNQTMTITIANNIIRTCSKSQNEQYANIKISGYSGSVPATEIVISGNQILNPDTNANHGYAGIHLLYCENSKVVGNTFFNVGDDEVLLDSTCENVLNDSKMSEELSALKTEMTQTQEDIISKGRVKLLQDNEWGADRSATVTGRSYSVSKNVATKAQTSASTSYRYSLIFGGDTIKSSSDSNIDTLFSALDPTTDFIAIPAYQSESYRNVILQFIVDLETSTGGNANPEVFRILTADSQGNISSANAVTFPQLNEKANKAKGIIEINLNDYAPSVLTNGKIAIVDYSRNSAWEGTVTVNLYLTPRFGNTVQDVQLNGTSILNAQGVANVPVASGANLGAVKVHNDASYGISVNQTEKDIRINTGSEAQIKGGNNYYRPIVPVNQHISVFYGLAKLAGADMAQSSNPVGQFTDDAKSKISDMLNAPVSVSGTTPTITGKAGLRYICGEVATLTITAPASGCIDVIFESGSTPTVLTVTSAKTGVSAIKWANGFDPTALEANTTYEINILDGELGVVGSWT